MDETEGSLISQPMYYQTDSLLEYEYYHAKWYKKPFWAFMIFFTRPSSAGIGFAAIMSSVITTLLVLYILFGHLL